MSYVQEPLLAFMELTEISRKLALSLRVYNFRVKRNMVDDVNHEVILMPHLGGETKEFGAGDFSGKSERLPEKENEIRF